MLATVTRDAAVFAVSVALTLGATLCAEGFVVSAIAPGRFECTAADDSLVHSPEIEQQWRPHVGLPKVIERHDWSSFGAAVAFVDSVGPAAAMAAVKG